MLSIQNEDLLVSITVKHICPACVGSLESFNFPVLSPKDSLCYATVGQSASEIYFRHFLVLSYPHSTFHMRELLIC